MTFKVCVQNKKQMLVVQVLCVLMIVGLAWFINLDFMEASLTEDGAYMLFMGFIGVFLLILAFSFYASRRPRIEVNDQDITFCSLWRPSKTITLQEITSRKVKADFSDPQKAAAAGVLGGGLLGYAITQKNATALQAPQAMIYTYYSGNVKLITVSTRNMKNVERFDKMVVEQLEDTLPKP